MSHTPPEALIWIGPRNPGDLHSLCQLFPQACTGFFGGPDDARGWLGFPRPVVIVHPRIEMGMDLETMARAIRSDAPEAVLILRVDRRDDPVIEAALAAGFDAIHASAEPGSDWSWTIRTARAFAQTRLRAADGPTAGTGRSRWSRPRRQGAASRSTLRDLALIAGRRDLTAEDRIRMLLEFGSEQIGARAAAVLGDGGVIHSHGDAALLAPLEAGDLPTPRVESPVLVHGSSHGRVVFFAPAAGRDGMPPAGPELCPAIAEWIGREIEGEHDAAALEEARRQLAANERVGAAGRHAGGIAHDFNNLVMGIRGMVKTLSDEAGLSPEARAEVREIDRAADQAQRLIRRLLKGDAEAERCPEPIALNDVVDEMRHTLVRLCPEQVDVVTELGADVGAVRMPRTCLEQVVLNLAVNARDAIRGAGTIRIATSRLASGEGLLAISDSGCG